MGKIKRNVLLNPGPATTTDTVKMAMVVPDICPREKEFAELIAGIRNDLVSVVAKGDAYTTVLFSGSGTAAMDSVISSVPAPGKKIAVIVNGAYGDRMVKIARAYNIPCLEIGFEWGEKIDIEKVERLINGDPDIDCLAVVHHETTTGILNPIAEIGKIAKKSGLTYIVDTISSYAGIPIDAVGCSIDYLMSTSNKCIQGMAGIAFVVCRKDALLKIGSYPRRSFYLSLYDQYQYLEDTGQTQFTAPVQVVYALRQAINEFISEGMDERYARYTESWKTLRKGLLDLGFKLLHDEEDESHILLTVLEPNNDGYNFEEMHDYLYDKGFTVYPGKIKNNTFRLAIIGAIDKYDIKLFLKELEGSLKIMGVKLK